MEQYLKFFNDKKILITGGGGYLGSVFAKFLSKHSKIVYLLDIKFNKLSEELITRNRNVIRIKADLTNFIDLANCLRNIEHDIIFHFASLLDRTRDFSDFQKFNQVNVVGTFNLLQNLKQIDYQRFFFASTSEVYGINNTPPFTEDMPPAPVSPYSLTKLMAEYLITSFSIQNNKPYSILRLFNFYGPNMPPNFLISQLEYALRSDEYFQMTGGEQKRDFLHVDQLINYLVMLCLIEKSSNEIINICSGESIKIKQFVIDFAKKVNKEHLLQIGALPYRNNEIWEMVGNNQKLLSLIKSYSSP